MYLSLLAFLARQYSSASTVPLLSIIPPYYVIGFLLLHTSVHGFVRILPTIIEINTNIMPHGDKFSHKTYMFFFSFMKIFNIE